MDSEHFRLLIGRKLSKQATDNELTELDNWIQLDHKNRILWEESKRIWDNSCKFFSSEEIEGDKAKVNSRVALYQKQKRVRLLFFYRIAAVLAIPALLAVGWYAGTRYSGSPANLICEVSAPKGQIAGCVLPDGTKVWLNTNSSIQYNPTLSGKYRHIKLKGEAYFNVAQNPAKPFIVETSDMRVKALGTSFNVKAYPGETNTETTLEEGRVQLLFNDLPHQQPVELMPGDHAVYQTGNHTIDIEKTDPYLLTAWRDGKYIFRDANLSSIVQQLEKLYDVRIHLRNEEMGQLRFRGMFEYNKNILDALETIERSTSFKYRMNGRDIWIDNK
ncbi:MAG: FecR domain-containing protein [Prolixibacteraceae bacterium]|jgi:ferric-dicitrate binding protein FerR (iron transport regulator)|nr:FecR domain-containing protein [Prolixibacteraceae bacterium]